MAKKKRPRAEVPRLAYRVNEIAEMTGLTRMQVYEEVWRRRLPGRKCRSALLILADDLRNWLECRRDWIETQRQRNANEPELQYPRDCPCICHK